MSQAEVTTAMILAGGVGSRLRSVIGDQPKVLAAIHGRPFLAYLLDALDAAGLRQVVLCTGYMADRVEAEFGPAYGKMRLLYSRETTPLGTGGAMRAGAVLIDAETVLVLNGDSYCEFNLEAMAAAHFARCAAATILLTDVPDPSRFGQVQIDGDGRLLAFDEKVPHAGPGLISAGIYLIERSMLMSIPAGRADSQ